jgi:transcriptional regulator EpsA
MRDHHDCLYVALHSLPNAIIPRNCRLMEILLPYIDTALRQVVDQPWRCDSVVGTATEYENMNKNNHLSARELEIMDWVRKGKTNQEIAMILNISVFTVKNHLQRIFKKLDVMNRAQAVASIVGHQGYARG